MTLSIPENLEKVRQLISLYDQEKYGRSDTAVQLIAVSKTHGADAVKSRITRPARCSFGENYLQEALEKIDAAESTCPWCGISLARSSPIKPGQ